jgi:hypothetical protein
MVRVCSMHRETRNACKILVGKSEGKRSLERRRCRWQVNVKLSLSAAP